MDLDVSECKSVDVCIETIVGVYMGTRVEVNGSQWKYVDGLGWKHITGSIDVSQRKFVEVDVEGRESLYGSSWISIGVCGSTPHYITRSYICVCRNGRSWGVNESTWTPGWKLLEVSERR